MIAGQANPASHDMAYPEPNATRFPVHRVLWKYAWALAYKGRVFELDCIAHILISWVSAG